MGLNKNVKNTGVWRSSVVIAPAYPAEPLRGTLSKSDEVTRRDPPSVLPTLGKIIRPKKEKKKKFAH
jgi:hypothetical protein